MRKKNRGRKRKRRRYSRMGTTRRHSRSEVSEANIVSDSDEKFGFHSGSDFTLEEFQKHADSFKEFYFGIKDAKDNLNSDGVECNKRWEPSVEDIEGEYWRIVEQPTDEVEVRKYGFSTPSLSPSLCLCLWKYILCTHKKISFSLTLSHIFFFFLLVTCYHRYTMELILKLKHL